MKKIILIFSCFLLAGNICLAQNELTEKTRKAKQSDMTGTWMMIYQTVSPLFIDKSLFFASYQIFDFSENGYVKNIASNNKLEKKKINSLFQRMPQGTVYGFMDEGLLIIERSKKDSDNIAIFIAVADFKKNLRSGAPLLKKGDLIFSYLDDKKNLFMQRYLRRMDLRSD
ncbi:MAG: hypothetical protein V1739_05745 [Candidatus Omnitrophota bacterium]